MSLDGIDRMMRAEHIGYVVHYKEDPDNAASGFDAGAYVPRLAGGWIHVATAMMQDRPAATLCIVPVTSIPEWVE